MGWLDYYDDYYERAWADKQEADSAREKAKAAKAAQKASRRIANTQFVYGVAAVGPPLLARQLGGPAQGIEADGRTTRGPATGGQAGK